MVVCTLHLRMAGSSLASIESVAWARTQQTSGELRHHLQCTHRDCRLQEFQRSAAYVLRAGVLIAKSVLAFVDVGC